MNRTVVALSLALALLFAAVVATGNAGVASAASPVWVEVARGSGGIGLNGPAENGTDLFSVSHIEWRILWSVVPVESGLPVGNGSDFRFIVRPEIGRSGNIADVSGKVFSEPETGVIVIFAHNGFKYSFNRTFCVETHVSGYTSYELTVEENVNSPFLDIVPPVITVFSPQNTTYDVKKNVSLLFTVDKPPSGLWYMLDNDDEVGILSNISISGISAGAHNLTVYARDDVGNISSEVIYFSLEEPFTTTLFEIAIVIIVILFLGVLAYYLKKRKG